MSERGNADVSPDEIRLRSYLIWEREGRPDGREVDHWLRAEAELMEEAGTTAVMKAAKSKELKRSRASAGGTSAGRPRRKVKT